MNHRQCATEKSAMLSVSRSSQPRPSPSMRLEPAEVVVECHRAVGQGQPRHVRCEAARSAAKAFNASGEPPKSEAMPAGWRVV